MIRSEGWKPAVMWSSSAKPVARPVMCSLRSASSCIRSKARGTMVLIGLKALGLLGAGDLEDRLLRLVHQAVDIVLLLVAAGRHLVGGLDQAAQDGFLADDAGVVNQGAAEGDDVGERGQVGGSAHLVELVLVAEQVGQGDEVMGLPLVEQLEDGAVDRLVRVPVEILGLEDFDDFQQGPVLEEDRAEDSLLQLPGSGEEPSVIWTALRCQAAVAYESLLPAAELPAGRWRVVASGRGSLPLRLCEAIAAWGLPPHAQSHGG